MSMAVAIKETTHSFYVKDAEKNGVVGACLLHHIKHWVTENRAKGSKKHYHNGQYWMYSSVQNFIKYMPYLSAGKVKYALKCLIKEGVLVKGVFNQKNYDSTNWYSLASHVTQGVDSAGTGNTGGSLGTILPEPHDQSIPIINTIIKKDKNIKMVDEEMSTQKQKHFKKDSEDYINDFLPEEKGKKIKKENIPEERLKEIEIMNIKKLEIPKSVKGLKVNKSIPEKQIKVSEKKTAEIIKAKSDKRSAEKLEELQYLYNLTKFQIRNPKDFKQATDSTGKKKLSRIASDSYMLFSYKCKLAYPEMGLVLKPSVKEIVLFGQFLSKIDGDLQLMGLIITHWMDFKAAVKLVDGQTIHNQYPSAIALSKHAPVAFSEAFLTCLGSSTIPEGGLSLDMLADI